MKVGKNAWKKYCKRCGKAYLSSAQYSVCCDSCKKPNRSGKIAGIEIPPSEIVDYNIKKRFKGSI